MDTRARARKENSMRQYELTYLISDDVKESELNKVTGKIGGFISDLEGRILKEEIWKRRKLAYPIKKQEFAVYVTLNFEVPADKMLEFERDLRLLPSVLRHITIVKDYGEEKLTLTAEEIAGTEDIEEAIGGEQSFEAVEGETEESRDLMAVRKTEELEENQTEEPENKKIEKWAGDEVEVKEEKVKEVIKEEAKEKPQPKADQPLAGKKKKTKPAGPESEADRLAKLDKELDELLKDDL